MLGDQSLVIAVMGGGSSSSSRTMDGVREGVEEPALRKPFLKVTQRSKVITLMHFYNAFLQRFKMLRKDK